MGVKLVEFIVLAFSAFGVFCLVHEFMRRLHRRTNNSIDKYFSDQMGEIKMELSKGQVDDFEKEVLTNYLKELQAQIILNRRIDQETSKRFGAAIRASRQRLAQLEEIFFLFVGIYICALFLFNEISVIDSYKYLLATFAGWLGIKAIAHSAHWNSYFIGRVHFYNFLFFTILNCLTSIALGWALGFIFFGIIAH